MTEQDHDVRLDAAAAWLEALARGECPVCKRKVEKKQVGRCVYGDCGHRLYQGRLRKGKRV